jgi:UDP:flavonoid glycosyltransferase YjiC (YdhE family)
LSRFVLATFGSLGDLHPYIAIGRALRERGHEAVIASSAEYEASVAAAGLAFAAVRPSMAQLGDQQQLARRLFHPLYGPERLVREIVMPHLRDAYADLDRAAQGADLLVSHPLTFNAPIVATRRQLPWISTVLAPTSFLSAHDPPVMAGPNLLQRAHRLGPTPYAWLMHAARQSVRRWEAPLHDRRRKQGLPASKAVMLLEGQFSPHGTLALFDGVLADAQPDWPVNTQVCGMPLFDGHAADPALMASLHRFLDDGEAPLVFALGSSAVWIAERYWQHAIEAAQALGRRAILLAGAGALPAMPDGIRAFEYLPYSAVFPHAAAVVHQAGIGTLSQALRAGRPQLITPVAFDQPDNAARAARLGVARVLPFRQVTAKRMKEQLALLLEDARTAQGAERLAARLVSVDGAGVAADALIRAAGQGATSRA